MNQKGFTHLILLFLVLLIILGGIGYYFYSNKQLNFLPLNHWRASSVTSSSTPQPSTELNTLNVQFSQPQQVATATSSADPNSPGVYSYKAYKVGNVTGGKYQGGKLIDVYAYWEGPCKGAGCGDDDINRFIKLPNQIVFLTKDSYDTSGSMASWFKPPSPSNIASTVFGNISFIKDDNSTIPVLGYPKELTESNPKLVLNYGGYEEDSNLDKSVLTPVLADPIFGKIYTTKPGLGPQSAFYSENSRLIPKNLTSWHSAAIPDCQSSNCFTNNSFFVFRPDGTYLMYYFTPSFVTPSSLYNGGSNLSGISWDSGAVIDSPYFDNSTVGCSNGSADEIAVMDPSQIQDKDLTVLGTITATGSPIYGFKDPNNSLLKDFYSNYKDEITSFRSLVGADYVPSDYPTVISYNDFVAQYPILIWKDPLGRYIRLTNVKLVPPAECEPIIYLYPPSTEKVSLNFGGIVNMTDSTPLYNNGWSVEASTNGQIINLSDNKVYPYLYWEGYSSFYPNQDKGFVVKKSDVNNFFLTTLPKLGLNDQETNDFIKAWLPSFNASPYYFITFYDAQTLNELVPLNITPKPDTLIRIMMDFKPLSHPITVNPLIIPPAPQRKGFTVVEWGALKR